jgi:hypothetical protein
MALFTQGYSRLIGVDFAAKVAQDNVASLQRAGVPATDATAVFLDIEPNVDVDVAFLNAWYGAIRTAHYVPGLYASANVSGQRSAVCGSEVAGVALWSYFPSPGRTARDSAPSFGPTNFACQLDRVGWQYGIAPCKPDGTTSQPDAIGGCKDPNIDTDEVAASRANLLWAL